MSILSLIPMPSLAVAKGAAVVAALASCFAAGWSVNGWRIHSTDQAAELERRTVAAQAEIENRRTESLRSTNVIEALNAQTKRTQIATHDAAGVRTELDGLRGDLDALGRALPRCAAAAGGDNAAAIAELFGGLEAAALRLSASGAGIAAKADGHANDTLTLQQAWPKQ